jgi:3-oxoacyl-[acyl-carrier-protein] synthase II
MVVSTPRRVVITGVGLVSPLGSDPETLWAALASAKSGVAPLERLPCDFLPMSYAAEARDFGGRLEDFGPLEKEQQKTIRKGLKLMCREIQMGVAAAQRALADAGLKLGSYDPDRTGVTFGSDYIMTVPDEFLEGVKHCLGERRTFDFTRWAEEGMPQVTPLWLLKYLPNMPASHIAIYNDLRGPSNSLTIREASANLSIAEAYCTIVRGAADIILAGATGTRIHPMRTVHVVMQEQLATNGTDPAKASRPFDLNRRGMVVGEGAGAVILETLESARARGRAIYGEVVGHGSSSVLDRNAVAHCDRALRNVIDVCLRTSGLRPDDVGHVHAHGLSTRRSDAEEARALADAFAGRSRGVPVVAAKSNFGNLGAGSGAVELIASLLAMRHGRLFPVLNYEHVVTAHDVPPGDCVLNLNVTPQGQAAGIIVRRCD